MFLLYHDNIVNKIVNINRNQLNKIRGWSQFPQAAMRIQKLMEDPTLNV